MRNKKIIVIFILLAVLMLGIGYSAITNTTLNVDGNAIATPNPDNFTVKFTGTPTSSGNGTTTATITDDLNATINVTGLNAKGEKATVIYTIENASTDLSADLTTSLKTNTNEEYFKVTPNLAATTITAGNTTTLTVDVELIKTPISNDEETTIKIEVVATPVNPTV